MNPENTNLALAYVQAVSDKRFEQFSAFVHPDAELTGNVVSVRGATDFVKGFERLAPILLHNQVKKVFADGDEVCIIYDFITDTPAGAVPTVEWLTIQDGLIRSSWLLFDRSRWPEVLQVLKERTADT
jgi:hypothetical protein